MLNIVKITTILNPLDLIAPHSCRGCGCLGNALCNRCKKNILEQRTNVCPNCKHQNPTGNCPNCPDLPPTYVVDQRSELVGNLIHDLKYYSVRALASPLAELLNQTLPSIDGSVAIVPLPTTSAHIRARGFDHTTLIAKKFVKLRGSNYQVTNLLMRNKNSVQVGSDRKTRLSQASLAYEINTRIPISPDTTYILFDDVWTTGASLHAAHQKLQKAGAQKIVFAILALSV